MPARFKLAAAIAVLLYLAAAGYCFSQWPMVTSVFLAFLIVGGIISLATGMSYCPEAVYKKRRDLCRNLMVEVRMLEIELSQANLKLAKAQTNKAILKGSQLQVDARLLDRIESEETAASAWVASVKARISIVRGNLEIAKEKYDQSGIALERLHEQRKWSRARRTTIAVLFA